jgi:hypothetical protein
MSEHVAIEPAPGAPAPDVNRRWTAVDWLLIALLVTVAAWIRFTHIDAGLSFDELWHLASTQGIGDAMTYYSQDVVHHDAIRLTSLEHKQNLWHVWTGMDGILHPPLFIIALRLWREVMGQSDLAAHSFSIVFGVVSIVFTYASARLAMNRAAGTLAALAFALAQTQVYFSQEVRAYSMLIALGCVALWIMTRIEVLGPTRRRLLGLAFLTLPLLLTHYFSLGACFAIGIYGVVAGKPHRKAFLISIATCALLYLVVWVPFALKQLDDLGTGDVFLRSDTGAMHVLMLAGGSPFRLIVERDYTIELTPLLSAVLFVLPWLLIRRLPVLRPWVLWLCAAVIPIVILDLARTTVHTAYIRYLAIATPPVSMLFIGSIWAMGWRRMACGFGAVLSFAGAIYIASDTRILLDADDLTQIRRIIEPRFQKGDAIVTSSGQLGSVYAGAITLTLSHSDRVFPANLVIATRPLTREMVDELGTRTIWLVSGDLPVEPGEFVPGTRLDFSEVATSIITVRRMVIDDAMTHAATQPAN